MFRERWLRWREARGKKQRRGGPSGVKYVPEPLPPRSKRNGSELSLEGDSPGLSNFLFLEMGRKGKDKGPRMQRSEQKGCFLLSGLPYEIRTMIYREVLGGHWLHIVTKTKEEEVRSKRAKNKVSERTLMGHIICSGCDCECCFHDPTSSDRWDTTQRWRCHCTRWNTKGEFEDPTSDAENDSKGKKSSGGLLYFLKTCQQVYSEAIMFLYSSNTFDFPNLGVVISFKRTILPQRLANIRFIQTRYLYGYSCTGPRHSDFIWNPDSENLWWDIIAGGNSYYDEENNPSIPFLKEIRLVIPFYGEIISYQGDHSIFEPMRDLVDAVARANRHGQNAITVVVDFPVWLNRDQPELAKMLQNSPFLKLRLPRMYDKYIESGRMMRNGVMVKRPYKLPEN